MYTKVFQVKIFIFRIFSGCNRKGQHLSNFCIFQIILWEKRIQNGTKGQNRIVKIVKGGITCVLP